jgi:hypothetical protein
MIDLIKEYLSLSEIALHNANLVYSIPALSGYYRPIARKVKTVDRERFLFEGEENYWQGGRRADWVVREKVLEPELLEARNSC